MLLSRMGILKKKKRTVITKSKIQFYYYCSDLCSSPQPQFMHLCSSEFTKFFLMLRVRTDTLSFLSGH